LALRGIANSKARNTILVWHGSSGVQESQRSVAASLGVGTKRGKARALVGIVLEGHAKREVRRGVQSAAAFAAVERGREGVLVDPVGAGGGVVETLCGAVAGAVDAVFEVEVLHRHDARDVDAGKVADAAAVFGWGLEERELMLGDLALADGVVVVLVVGGEDVDVSVGIIILIADFVGREGSRDDCGGDGQDGENGGG